jgi:hypothetical protein
MIEGIVKGIMLTGLNKYSIINEVPVEEIQIKVSNDTEGTVFYDICKQFKTTERVRFTQIMDKKMDLLGYGSIASPFLKDSLGKFSEENGLELEKVCCFILLHNQVLYLSFYNEFKTIKTISLKKYLSEVGL